MARISCAINVLVQRPPEVADFFIPPVLHVFRFGAANTAVALVFKTLGVRRAVASYVTPLSFVEPRAGRIMSPRFVIQLLEPSVSFCASTIAHIARFSYRYLLSSSVPKSLKNSSNDIVSESVLVASIIDFEHGFTRHSECVEPFIPKYGT